VSQLRDQLPGLRDHGHTVIDRTSKCPENGDLSDEELRAILDALPIDITFVGADDTIRYYNRNQPKIYARCPELIGRRVQECHGMSERTGGEVTRILRTLREPSATGQTRWVEAGGRVLCVQYLPVRSENGAFLGVLQLTQEIPPRGREG